MELTAEQRAERASMILNDPVYSQAYEAIERDTIARLKIVGVSDEKMQRDLVITLQLLGQLKKRFETHIQTGKLEKLKPTQKRWRA